MPWRRSTTCPWSAVRTTIRPACRARSSSGGRCLTASAPHSVPPGSERSRASSMVFSTQVTSGMPVTSAIAAATSSAHGVPEPGGIQRLLVEQGRARHAVRTAQRAHTRAARRPGRRRAARRISSEARLTSVSVGSTARAAAAAVCPGSSASAQPSAARRQHAGDDLGGHPGAHPVQHQQQHGCAAGPAARPQPGSRSSRCRGPAAVTAPVRRWCARPARPRRPHRAPHAGPATAESTAASPAPRSGSLTPGAASLTAESTQASCSRYRPTSRPGPAPPRPREDGRPGPASRASRTAAWKAAIRSSPGPGQPVRGHPPHACSTETRVPGRTCGSSGACRPVRRARTAGRRPGLPAAGSARRAAGPSHRRGPRRGGAEQFVGPGQQDLTARPRVLAGQQVEDDGGAFAGPGRQGRGARGGGAEPGLQPDQAFPADPRTWPASALSPACDDQPGHQPERHAVAGLARPQQVQDRPADRPAASGGPVQDGAGERVAGQVAQVRDPGRPGRVSRPAQDAGRVDDRIGQAQCAAATAPRA